MKSVGAVLISAALTTLGCVAEEEEPSARVEQVEQTPTVTDQTEFDLTFLFDREQFIEQDLHYLDSVGPYAIYEVTGEAPRLVGPEVYYPTEPGKAAMLCAAHGFFAEPGTLVTAKLSLIDGLTGESFVEAQVRSAEFESCTSPSDDYGERIPTEPDDPDTPSEDMVPRSGQLVVDMEGTLPIGGLILLRRVAFGIEPDGHNGSHVIPLICCNSHFCGLGADAPLDEPIK